jgi:hypothetical protein
MLKNFYEWADENDLRLIATRAPGIGFVITIASDSGFNLGRGSSYSDAMCNLLFNIRGKWIDLYNNVSVKVPDTLSL